MYVCVNDDKTEEMEQQALKLCVTFLEEIARQTCTVVLDICAEQCNLNEKVLYTVDSITPMSCSYKTFLQTTAAFIRVRK